MENDNVTTAEAERSFRQAEPDSSLSQREPMEETQTTEGTDLPQGEDPIPEGERGTEEAVTDEEPASPTEPDVSAQTEELRRFYPGFDEKTDGADPAFRAMVAAGVPMRRAYEALHLEDLISGAMAYASRRTLERLAGAALAGQQRPEENGLRTGQPAAPVFDPRTMTKEQAKELRDRVFRGEKVYL